MGRLSTARSLEIQAASVCRLLPV